MQIQNNFSISNQTTSPNFKAIKSVTCSGLYKKHPQLADRLVNVLQYNYEAMKFFKDVDVDIVFHACKEDMERTESSINIFYDNPVKKSGIKKFLDLISGKKETIRLTTYGNKSIMQESLEESTENLIEYISPYTKGNGASGILNSHIELANKTIQEALAKKSKKEEERLAKIAEKNYKKIETENATKSLQDSIDNLIRNSKA